MFVQGSVSVNDSELESFITFTQVANVIKHFTAVSYEFS